MKKLNMIKYIVLSIVFISILILPNIVQATNASIGTVIRGGDSFISAGSSVASPVDGDQLKNISSNIYNILLAIAIVVAVAIATYLGIQYITSSAMDKAKVKESFLALVLGCIVAFGAFGIWKVLVVMLGQI